MFVRQQFGFQPLIRLFTFFSQFIGTRHTYAKGKHRRKENQMGILAATAKHIENRASCC